MTGVRRSGALGVVATLVLAAAATPAYAGDLVVVARPTPVTAWGGHVLWSAFDPATQTYALIDAGPAGIRPLPVRRRGAPFDVDAGPDRAGRPAAVYSRCAVETASPLDLPRGCDIWQVGLDGGGERLVRSVSAPGASETAPTIWRGRIAFARRYENRRGLESRVAILYAQRRAGSRHLLRLPGGAIPRCEPQAARASCEGSIRAGPAALDLAGRRLAFLWLHAGGTSFGVGPVTEVGVVNVTRRPSTELLQSVDIGGAIETPCDVLTLASPSIAAGKVSWLMATDANCPTPVSSVVRRDLAAPATTRAPLPGADLAVAFDGTRTIALEARGAPGPVFSEQPEPCEQPGRACVVADVGSLAFAPFSLEATGPDALCFTFDLRRRARC